MPWILSDDSGRMPLSFLKLLVYNDGKFQEERGFFMFTVILEKNILFYLMVAAGVVSILAKLVSRMTIRRLTRAAENMSKSNHRLMKLIRAKFEHATMVSDKVQNVDAFVDKYLFEYKVWGLRVHSWRELEKQMIVVSGLIAAVGFVWSYNLAGMLGDALYYSAGGIAEMIALYLIYQWGDESHAWNLIHIYIVDFLENVCAHKMSKAYRDTADGRGSEATQRLAGEELRGQPGETRRISSDERITGREIPQRAEYAKGEELREKERQGAYDRERGAVQEAERGGAYDRAHGAAQEAERGGAYDRGHSAVQEAERGGAYDRGHSAVQEAERRSIYDRERGTMQGQDRETLRNQIRESLGGKADELLRNAGRDPARGQAGETLRVTESERSSGEELPQRAEYAEDPAMAIQIDEARKNMERDAEERKILIREILEQYLA
jgi:hypothetical protein